MIFVECLKVFEKNYLHIHIYIYIYNFGLIFLSSSLVLELEAWFNLCRVFFRRLASLALHLANQLDLASLVQ